MSIKIMSQVWDNGPKDRGQLLVLLALADNANEAGECWPSVATIARKSRMEPRSVQRICRSLVDDGWMHIVPNAARNGCNLYRLTPDARVTPDTVSPLTPTSPPPDARVTPPLTPVSPEPSRTTIEPPVEKKERDEIAAVLCKFASPSAVASFIAYRKGKRDPLTLTAATRLAGSLQEILNAGFDPSDALGLAEERGWKTVKAAWYFKDRSDTNDNSNPGPRQSSDMRENRIDPALANIARLTGLDRSPGNGGG